jgi:hypothetical protein
VDYVERLARLFRGLPRAYGVYDLSRAKQNGTKKVEGSARTIREPVTVQRWRAHVDGNMGLGIVPINDESISYFGAIDVDHYDVDIREVERQVADYGMPLMPTRTKSGGVHLYFFSASGVSAQLLRARLNEWSVMLGFGGAEVFPKQNALMDEADVGNWINMPYFGAAREKNGICCWDRHGILHGQPLDLAAYLDRAELFADRLTEDMLKQIVIEDANGEFEQGPPCLVTLSARGFGEGQRNKGLFAVGVYLKKRFPDEWEAKLYLYNKRYMRPPLADDEVKTIIKSLKRKEYNYACSQDPIKSHCNRLLCRTKEFGIGKADSKDWGIVIDSEAQMICTDPPYWILTVNGTRIRFFSEDLMRQPRFQELCMQKLSFLPPPLPRDEWLVTVNKILSSAVKLEAPQDSGPEGELYWHLQQFCTVYPQAETREEIPRGAAFPLIDRQ